MKPGDAVPGGGSAGPGSAGPGDPPEVSPVADDEEGPLGPFRSWGALYATVIVWDLSMILLLYLFTVFLNFGTPAP